ncbi:unnamed protein product [Mesocestoides corti]|uniref:ATP-dependent RNA helicase n=1 Tax=Mesocestoides corti TaxID=53468 RepID=A0A0R3UJ87_MESCO|nr:unnamed protein product [Mesocestoides corti]
MEESLKYPSASQKKVKSTFSQPVITQIHESRKKSRKAPVVSGVIKVKKLSHNRPPDQKSLPVVADGDLRAKSDLVKREDESPRNTRNPLQVGLSAKQHQSQLDLLNIMSETINPNIESVFSKTSWENFGSQMNLHPHLLSIIQKNFRYQYPTAIQVSAIRKLCEGRDALIKAQTGSGKTLAYALPMLNSLMMAEPRITRSDGPKSLIILPTRELAAQTASVMTQLCRACVRIVPGCLVGGMKRKGEKARKGLNIIVGTPRRLLDHLGKTAVLSLRALQWLIIDEADRLVELGFERDVGRIIDRVSRETHLEGCDSSIQTVLLSATLTPGVETLAGLALKNPVKCDVSDELAPDEWKSSELDKRIAPFSMPSGLKHFLLIVPCKQRLVALAAFMLLKTKYSRRSGKLMVFFATQDCVDFHYRLFTEALRDGDGKVDESGFHTNNLHLYRLHGNMDPKERQAVFQAFSSCPDGILITTDVASRGLDLAGVAWVVQYHVSGTPIDYVHRVGRTARAGGRGKALLMLQPEEESYTQMLSATVGLQVEKLKLSDVLQTALFHLQRKGRQSVTTVEEAAASMSKHFFLTVADEPELSALAEKAYVSFLRAYASFTGEMRVHFAFKRLHLGHVARAFCLHATPSDIASRVTGKRPASSNRMTEQGSNTTVNKSRRLELADKTGEQRPLQRKHKPKPSELATRNMLAEYGL